MKFKFKLNYDTGRISKRTRSDDTRLYEYKTKCDTCIKYNIIIVTY